jgi:hypothetical protein
MPVIGQVIRNCREHTVLHTSNICRIFDVQLIAEGVLGLLPTLDAADDSSAAHIGTDHCLNTMVGKIKH